MKTYMHSTSLQITTHGLKNLPNGLLELLAPPLLILMQMLRTHPSQERVLLVEPTGTTPRDILEISEERELLL